MVCHTTPFLSPSVLLVTSEDYRRDGRDGRCDGGFPPCTGPLPRQTPILCFALLAVQVGGKKK